VRSRAANTLLSEIAEYLAPVVEYLSTASQRDIRDFRQRYAQAGVQASAYTLLGLIRARFPDFDPPGLAEYIAKTDTTNNQAAYQCTSEIEMLIHPHVIAVLKKEYGDGYSNWWHRGVREKIRSGAVILANRVGQYDSFENHLHLIDLKDIIEDNWTLFRDVYTIDAKPNDSKVKCLKWFTETNRIRNIHAHPPTGGVTDDELAYVQRIREELERRIHPAPARG